LFIDELDNRLNENIDLYLGLNDIMGLFHPILLDNISIEE